MAQVGEIQARAADLEDAAEIVPLALGGFAPRAVPFQLAEDGVLGGRHGAFERLGAERSNLSERAAAKFGAAVVIFAQGKHIELIRGCVVNQVEGAAARE